MDHQHSRKSINIGATGSSDLIVNILAIETATEACSAALSVDGEVSERYQVAPRRHAELILPMVDDLLKQAGLKIGDMDGFAFGRGPGAFTGVRIATGVIQGLAFGVNRPVVGVSTLAALAQGAADDAPNILAAIDARMGEVYWGAFSIDSNGLAQARGQELVCAPGQVEIPEGDASWLGVGSGWSTYGDLLRQVVGDGISGAYPDRFPRAEDVLALALPEFEAGRSLSADQALPIYLRDKVTG